MTQQQMISLSKFLYFNDNSQTFLCNDLFQEFLSIIPKTKCICSDNIVNETREKNFNESLISIRNFLNKNQDYKDMVEKIFSSYIGKELDKHLLTGYVFFLSLTDKQQIDIFKDKKSICFTDGPSLADIIA